MRGSTSGVNECYTSYGRPLRHSDIGQYNRRYRAGAISRRMCVHGMLTSVNENY